MSAIFGLVHSDARSVSVTDLESMKKAMEVYGPDMNAVWHCDNVGMGQSLMRITPQDVYENQPSVNDAGINTVVSDGRIDNRIELSHKLAPLSRSIALLPDSALILAAYDKWGCDCLFHLRGSFAFAIWNQSEKQLFLACSQMGERPLYYSFEHGIFAFSSMPKGLFALNSVKREIDNSYLADYLTDSYIDPSRSLYCGINKLPFGQALLFTSSGLKVWRYWQPELLPSIQYNKDKEYVDAFGELLSTVVKDHCKSLTSVGVMLSGGLDSSAVAAVAARHLLQGAQKLFSFTEVPDRGVKGTVIDGRYADETPFVNEIAKMHENIQPSFVSGSDRFFLDGATDFFAASDMPFRNSANKIWIDNIHEAAREKGVRVLLTGTQGNLTISWNGRNFLPQLIKSGRVIRAIGEARNVSRHSSGRNALRVLLGYGVAPLLPGWLYKSLYAMRRPRDFFNSWGRYPWHGYSPIRDSYALSNHVFERAMTSRWGFHSGVNIDSNLTRMLIFGLSSRLADLAAAYRALYGVESRDVPADSRLVEFCMRIPEEQWLYRGEDRSLLRRAMNGQLPVSVLKNRQRGQQAAEWIHVLRKSVSTIKNELGLLKGSPFICEVLDLERLERLATALPNDNGGSCQQLLLDYRNVLCKGLMVGRFLRWFESGE